MPWCLSKSEPTLDPLPLIRMQDQVARRDRLMRANDRRTSTLVCPILYSRHASAVPWRLLLLLLTYVDDVQMLLAPWQVDRGSKVFQSNVGPRYCLSEITDIQ